MRIPFISKKQKSTQPSDAIEKRVINLSRDELSAMMAEDTVKDVLYESTQFACVRVLGDTIAQLPFEYYSEDAKKVKHKMVDTPLFRMFKYQPTPAMTPFNFWKLSVSDLLVHGFFIYRKIYGSKKGDVRELEHIDPTKVTEFNLHKRTGKLQFTIEGRATVLKQEDTFFCYYSTRDGITPQGPMDFAQSALKLAKEAERRGQEVFKNSANPGGTLSVPGPLSDEGYKRMAESWVENHGARYGKSGGVAILEEGAVFKPIATNSASSQLLQTRQYQRQEICGINGIAPHMIGDTTQAKGWSTLEQQTLEFVMFTINPLVKRIEDAARRDFIAPSNYSSQYFKFNMNSLLRGDLITRIGAYRGLFDLGVLTTDEIRVKEDLTTVEGGDIRFVSTNIKPLIEVKTDG